MAKLLLIALVCVVSERSATNAFDLRWLYGDGDSEEKIPNPRKDLVKDFGGEEEYKRRIAKAYGAEDYETIKAVVEANPDYGVDISYPVHRAKVSTNFQWLPHNTDPEKHSVPRKYKDVPVQIMGDMQTMYEENIQGCKDHYPKHRGSCEATERDRVAMNLRQPQSMQNYTDLGFTKIRAPKKLANMLLDFYNNNKDKQTNEKWFVGNTYTNHWKAPTYMLSVENSRLPGGGNKLKNRIWDAARSTMQEWTGENLTPCSLYGIRIYKEGAILAPHVDRLPLVSSAIINVAQDVDEDWPIEVYGHDGKAYNITMEPGDMVLYESHSVIHGRPFPLKGRFYANVFIHFEPSGHSLRYEDKVNGGNAEELYMKARANGEHKLDSEEDDLPSYIVRGTPEEKKWRQEHPKKSTGGAVSFATGSNSAHQAASFGDLDKLEEIVKMDKDSLHAADANGWLPLHEGARGGHTDVVKFLVEQGGAINARTNQGKGGNVLWWAMEAHGKDHPVVKFLLSKGAVVVEPEL